VLSAHHFILMIYFIFPGIVVVVIVCYCVSNYMYNQCLSLLKLESRSWRSVLDTTLCNKVCQWLAEGRWFSPGIQVSSTNKTDRHYVIEILKHKSGVKHS